MAKTANINLRIDPKIKSQAEELFLSFGISVTDAVNIFLNTYIINDGFPFQIVQPRYNKDTELAIEEARKIIAGELKAKTYNSAKELLDSIELED